MSNPERTESTSAAWYLGAESQDDTRADQEGTLAVILADTAPKLREAVEAAFWRGTRGEGVRAAD